MSLTLMPTGSPRVPSMSATSLVSALKVMDAHPPQLLPSSQGWIAEGRVDS